MAERIKGITVAINGDVTGLDKALRGVNKEIKSTQDQLKDVERLLKLDPTNTELLAQKQSLLSRQVEQTSAKLKELKHQKESVTADNTKYEEWQRSFSILQGQITKTEKELSSLEKAQKSLLSKGVAPDSEELLTVQQRIGDTKKTLESLKEQVNNTYEAMGRPISTEEYERLTREVIDTEQAAKAAEDAYRSFDPALQEVSVTADKLSGKLAKVSDATRGISTVAGGALVGIAGAAYSSVQRADDLNTMSKQTGFTTEELQKIQYAADVIDVELETVTSAMSKMKKNMDSTSSDVQEAWSRIGVSVRDASGNFRNSNDVFNDTLMALSRISNETERDTLAMSLFGRSADQLAGLIDDGGAAMRELGKQAEDLGLIMSQDTLDSLNAVNDQIDTLKAQASGALATSGAKALEALMPVISDLLDAGARILEWISSLDEGTIRLIVTVLAFVAAISPVAGILSSVFGAVSSITGALPGLISGVSAVTGGLDGLFSAVTSFVASNPIALIVAAIVALVALIAAKGDEIQAILQKLDDWLHNVFASDWTELFGPVLGEALNGLFANLENIWSDVKSVLDGIIDFIRGVFTGDWERAWNGVVEIFSGIIGLLGDIVKAPINGIIAILNSAIAGINTLIQGINSIEINIPDWVPILGGKSFSPDISEIEKIPYLANGGILSSGSAVVGEAGPELLTMAGGRAVVQPLTATLDSTGLADALKGVGGSGDVMVNIRFDGSLAQLGRILQPHVTAETARRGPSFSGR